MTISLKLPKDCKEAVWIQEIATFTTALRQEKYNDKTHSTLLQ
jgi:transcription-repair coupling factor (superfamily II helicase)